MLTSRSNPQSRQRGTSLLEVLVTILILTFGLLGLAGLQTNIQLSEFESYQRAQAILLLADMSERINANRQNAASYVTTGTIGTGDTAVTCAGSPGPTRDICEWRNALLGASEKKSAANIGAIIGARGCITQIVAPNATAGVCSPGVYRVAVAWQGLSASSTPAVSCGAGLYGGKDKVISTRISVGLTSC